VGARSGLFLPFKNLKLIIVDEEHDQSFKQEEGVIYNARDMAIIRAKEENIPILLCSATPSVETIHNVRLKKYKEYKLPSRYGVAVMPEVKLIDMHKQMMPKGKWISAALKEEMIRTYNQGKQSLLFLNRRGYAPATYCGSCHEKVGCPNCNFLLVEHRNKKILQCHYCGHKVPPITQCPFCSSSEKIYSLGPGVERIAEEVSSILPEARVAILASDTTPDRKNISELIDDITNHKVDIIVGTQMITKGLHFPQLHLVGVIDAEGGIFGCDIRAVERTYQLLHQVSGRAGREKDKGIVLLQTYEPESHLLKKPSCGKC
jgi:primosomal protein N' (replication factor Y)